MSPGTGQRAEWLSCPYLNESYLFPLWGVPSRQVTQLLDSLQCFLNSEKRCRKGALICAGISLQQSNFEATAVSYQTSVSHLFWTIVFILQSVKRLLPHLHSEKGWRQSHNRRILPCTYPHPPRTGVCQESGGCTTQQVFSAVPGGQGLEQQTLISLRPPVKREAGF